jgi:hypothetical protein
VYICYSLFYSPQNFGKNTELLFSRQDLGGEIQIKLPSKAERYTPARFAEGNVYYTLPTDGVTGFSGFRGVQITNPAGMIISLSFLLRGFLFRAFLHGFFLPAAFFPTAHVISFRV